MTCKSIVAILSTFWFTSFAFSARIQDFESTHSRSLEIQNIAFEVPNNSPEPYLFTLSVLGYQRDSTFVPLLAIAVENLSRSSNQWMAVWNLSQGNPGWLQNAKALIPFHWSSRSTRKQPADFDLGDESGDFPAPFLTWQETRTESWKRFNWGIVRKVGEYLDLFNPLRFFFYNFSHYRDDLSERRFHQVYTLLQLYEETALLQSSSGNLTLNGLADLKYQALVNRSAFGILFGDRARNEVIEHYESARREQAGRVASFLHAEANLAHLEVDQVHYGLAGRPPFMRTAVLYIRKSALPDPPPDWVFDSSFGLGFNPYYHPQIRELMDKDPDDRIPLAFYSLNSEFQLKPVMIANIFEPGSVRAEELTGTAKLLIDNFLDVRKIPFVYRTLKAATDYGLQRRDARRFSTTSTAAGIEQVRLFANLGWNFDEDTNDLLLKSTERRTMNPLTESFRVQRINAIRNYRALLADDQQPLELYLRRLFEDRVRERLKLGNRAVMAADWGRFQEECVLVEAQEIIDRFNRQSHLSGISWNSLQRAWELVQAADPHRKSRRCMEFLSKLDSLYPHAIPAPYVKVVARWLNVEQRMAGIQ